VISSRASTRVLEQTPGSGSEYKAPIMRQICHAAGLHVCHSACVEELSQKPDPINRAAGTNLIRAKTKINRRVRIAFNRRTPDEYLGLLVVVFNVILDSGDQFLQGVKATSPDALLGQITKPTFD
jgi:hypothetical protein